jgi:hypothetical protein
VGGDVLYNLWCDHFARSAPDCKGIEDDNFVVFESRLEFGLARWMSVFVCVIIDDVKQWRGGLRKRVCHRD